MDDIFFFVFVTGFPTVDSDSIQGFFLYVGMGFLAKASQFRQTIGA